ncbi:MAG: glycosyltransferase [Gammaproteobacteria bacterium]|nr:glycosyltransferase [Gammaproteobacteria bacterium]
MVTELLTYTSLYPNSAQIRHGIFIENRIRKLVETNRVNTRIVAPAPWFPFKNSLFGNYAEFAQIPHQETRHGLTVFHPRYPLIPRLGMNLTPLLMAIATYPTVKLLHQQQPVQVIDAHYFYPDGVAAALIGKWLGIPVIISARGTDINLFPDFFLARKMIIWAARQAEAVITVTQALKTRLTKLGIATQHINVLPNGVDHLLFKPKNRQQLRKQYQITRPVLLFVGNLIPLKGVDIIINALTELPEFDCLIIGQGPEKTKLENLARQLNVQSQVQFINHISQEKLVDYYNIADILILPSSREGCANVLLEANACGTPVIATNVGGNPDIVLNDNAGLLMKNRDCQSLIHSVKQLFASKPQQNSVIEHAKQFAWTPIINRQIELYQSVT